MPSMFFDKDRQQWIYQYRSGNKNKKKRLPKIIKTKSQAMEQKSKLDKKFYEASAGIAQPKKLRWLDAFDRFIEAKEGEVTHSTHLWYKSQVARWKEYLAARRTELVSELRPEVVADFVTIRRKDGAAPKSIQDDLVLIRGVINWLIRIGDMDMSPVRIWPQVRAIPVNPERLGYYSTEEVIRLIQYFKESAFLDIFLFAIFTGARRDEITSLLVQDVSLSKMEISLRNSKTVTNARNMYRSVPIADDLVEVLRRRINGSSSDAVVFSEMHSHSRNWPHVQMTRACKALDIPYRRFHGLRHTFATQMGKLPGVSLADLMAHLGHTQLSTTQRYTHGEAGGVNSLPYSSGKKAPPKRGNK
ncbi:MAG: site-specific integrase [Candidatus Riflebacteria bacterium]|nr:site-specific integrase [Candidatus Riflebacteria bacterium]